MNYESTRTVKLLTLLTDKLDPGQASQTNHKTHQVYSNQFCRLQLHFDTTLPSLHHPKLLKFVPIKNTTAIRPQKKSFRTNFYGLFRRSKHFELQPFVYRVAAKSVGLRWLEWKYLPLHFEGKDEQRRILWNQNFAGSFEVRHQQLCRMTNLISSKLDSK